MSCTKSPPGGHRLLCLADRHVPRDRSAYPFAVAALYLLEKLRGEIEDPEELSRLKPMVVDEAWRCLRDPNVLGRLTEAARTWRKRNAALVPAAGR